VISVLFFGWLSLEKKLWAYVSVALCTHHPGRPCKLSQTVRAAYAFLTRFRRQA